MNNLLKIGILLIFSACASSSLSPYMDEYREIKAEYESGLASCQDYFVAMKALLDPSPSKEGPNEAQLTADKSKVFEFIKNYRYPVEVVQAGHNFNSYIFKPYVQDSDEFEEIYEDYTNKESFGEGTTCEESQTVLSFYTALIPGLTKDFKRLTERNSFLYSIKNYINAKKFMNNEPLNSALVDIKILELLTEFKFTKLNADSISKVIEFAESQQEKLQKEFKVDLNSSSDKDLDKLTDDADESGDIKKLNKAHRKEMIIARKVRRKINKLMKKF